MMADTIPDNLRRLYELGSQHRAWVRTADDVATEEGGRIGPHPSVCDLIERIAKAEAALAAKDAEWQKVLSQSISTSNANVAAAQDEIERLKADVDALAQQLENGEEMYIAMRERCAGVESHLFRAQDEYESLEHQNAALREQLATRTAPVSDEEWRLTGSGIGNQTVAWRFEIDRLLAARDKADDAVKENNGNA
jgi:chromosome segregation ATPase